MNKSIVLVGVVDDERSTNFAQAKYFERLGYNVIPINYRTVLQEHRNMEYLFKLIQHSVEVYKPVLVFFSKCNGIPSDIIKWCSEKIKVWLWMMDGRHNVTDEILTHVKYATFASATCTEVAKRFKEINPNSHFIIEGYDEDVCFKEELDKEYNIVFIGNATDKRVEQLRKTSGVTIFGNGWPSNLRANPQVFRHDFRKVVCSSKLVLNLVHGNIFSNRVVDSLACGTPVLSEYCEDLKHIFPTVYTFKDISKVRFDMIKLIELKKGSFELPKNLHLYTWKNILRRVLEIAEV